MRRTVHTIDLGHGQLLAPGAVSHWLGIPERPRLIQSMGARELASGIGILRGERPVGWMWSRVAGDVVDLAMLGAALPASSHRARIAGSLLAVGGILALDYACANQLSRRPGVHRTDLAKTGQLRVRKYVTINTTPDVTYSFWRNFENLPRFMRHVKSVKAIEGGRYHWEAKTSGIPLAWDAEIVTDEPGSRLSWRSVRDAAFHHEGTVSFESASPKPGTVVSVEIDIKLPIGPLAQAFSALLGKTPGRQIEDDLRSLKQLLETGEVATTEGQPTGRDFRKVTSKLSMPATLPDPETEFARLTP